MLFQNKNECEEKCKKSKNECKIENKISTSQKQSLDEMVQFFIVFKNTVFLQINAALN